MMYYLYKTEREWTLEPARSNVGMVRNFATAKLAKSFAKKKGAKIKRLPKCDS